MEGMSSNPGVRGVCGVALLGSLLLAVGCVTGSSAGARGNQDIRAKQVNSEHFGPGGRGASKQTPYPACGPKDSYHFIARIFVCPDGSNPFKGDLRAAALSRRGNVGSHLDHMPEDFAHSHIVDVYAVPCPDREIDVYVCMYHCPE